MDCRGLVFEPPCPDNYVAGIVLERLYIILFYENHYYFRITFLDNVVVGNLIVRADPTFGGGELNISGPPFFSTFFYSPFVLFHNSNSIRLRAHNGW